MITIYATGKYLPPRCFCSKPFPTQSPQQTGPFLHWYLSAVVTHGLTHESLCLPALAAKGATFSFVQAKHAAAEMHKS